jgi:hypothetical protein
VLCIHVRVKQPREPIWPTQRRNILYPKKSQSPLGEVREDKRQEHLMGLITTSKAEDMSASKASTMPNDLFLAALL